MILTTETILGTEEPLVEAAIPQPELVFYDDAAWVLSNDYKLLTMRWPNEKYDFKPGTVIRAICRYEDADGVKREDVVELIVIANATRALCDFSPLVLMCDGFTSPEDGVAKLSRFYHNRGGVAPDTDMQAIFTMTKDQFDFLGMKAQRDLLQRGFAALDDERQPFQGVTWRSACFWFLSQFYDTYEGNNCWPAWVRYVLTHNQFGQSRVDDVVDVEALVEEITAGEDPISADDLFQILQNPIIFTAEFNKYVLLFP